MKTIRFHGFDEGCSVSLGATQGALSGTGGQTRWRHYAPKAFGSGDWTAEASGSGIALTLLALPEANPGVSAVEYSTDQGASWAALPGTTATQAVSLGSDGTPLPAGPVRLRLRGRNEVGAGRAGADLEIARSAGPGLETGVTGTAAVTITVTRGADRVAPEPVIFEASDHVGFELPPQTSVGVWKPEWHRLLHVWDFGAEEAGSFEAVSGLTPEHNDKRHAYGPKVFHVYERPGPKTVTLRLYDLAGALVHEKSVGFTVEDAGTVFGGARTIAVDPAAQPGWAGAPAGARKVASIAEALAALRSLGETGRILLRGGASHVLGARAVIDEAYPNFRVDTYGAGRATLDHGFDVTSAFGPKDAVIRNVTIRGGYSNVTRTGTIGESCAFKHGGIGALVNHDVWGCGGIVGGPGQGKADDTTRICLWNLAGGDYGRTGGTITTESPFFYLMGRGVRLMNPSRALQLSYDQEDPENQGEQWLFRLGGESVYYFESFDFFNQVGNRSASNATGAPVGHNIIRTNRTGRTLFASFQRGQLEGKVHFASSAGDPIQPGNLIFDKILHLGNAQTAVSFEAQASGMTARNIVMTMPNVGGIQSTGWGAVFTFDNGLPDNAAERTEVYSCTLHSTHTAATLVKANGSSKAVPTYYNNVAGRSATMGENNVFHIPGRGVSADGPFPASPKVANRYPRLLYRELPSLGNALTDTAYLPAKPTVPLGTDAPEYAAPAILRPDAASACYRTALRMEDMTALTGLVAADDFYGRFRGPNPSRGAVEPA